MLWSKSRTCTSGMRVPGLEESAWADGMAATVFFPFLARSLIIPTSAWQAKVLAN